VPVTGVITWPTSTGGINYQIGMTGREWFNQHAYRARAEYTFSPSTFASVQYSHESRGGGFNAYDTFLRNASGSPVDGGLVSFVDPAGATRILSITPANFLSSPTGASTNRYQAQVLHTFNSKWNLRILGGVVLTPNWWYITPASNATLNSGGGSYTPQVTRGHYGNIQFGWNPVRRHQFIFGTETRHDAAGIQAVTVPNYASRDGGTSVTSQASGQSVNQAVYLQDQIILAERFNVVAGARYDYWSTYDGSNQTSATVPPAHYPDKTSNSYTAKVAATYQAPAGFQIRASVGNAFRNPTIYELYRNVTIGSSLYAANPAALPERLLSFDGGVTRRFGSIATLEVSYFENRVHDMLYRTTDLASDPTGHLLRLTNAALGRIRGVEMAANERVLPWLQFKQTYTYTDGVITDNPSLPATVGKHLPQVPSQMTSFIVLANRNRWTGSASGRYQSAVFSTDTNTDIVHGVPGSYNPFFTADLSAGYEVTKHVTFTANVYNVLDRRYYLYYLAAGRQVFAGLRIRL
jgi:iron complex outermembrane receptor protein